MSKNEEWLKWQRAVIREEYKDLKIANEQVQKQFNKTVKESLNKCKVYAND